jgi:hypothetical protein
LAAIVAFFVHAHAYGEADERGFTFRQYIREHFVPWEYVESVEVRHTGLTLWVKTLAFPLYFGFRPGELLGGLLHRETPEIVPWILAKIK